MSTASFRYPVWVRGDLDGFFGLMVDNLVQVLTIVVLCTTVAGLPADLIYLRILPGVAISLLIGNVFYGAQAHYVARRDRNPGCTALPYGINTPSVFAFVLFVMGPVYRSALADGATPEAAGDLAWKAGLLACLVSGVIEFVGAFFAERLRRVTPRAALLGVLAGVGIALIASDFAFRIYTAPLVGLLPLGILLLAYFGRYRFPLGLPGGFLVVLFGTAIAWGVSLLGIDWFGGVKMSAGALRSAVDEVRWIQPVFCGSEIMSVLSRPDLLLRFLTVSIPMGLLNALGSLQNIESADAGGDRFRTGPSLAVNGLGTIAAGLFGSCFPTTIYIGHPGWKAMGARAGYSILNGLFFTALFLFGCGTFLAALIPIEAGAAIVMYIGIVITAQAFQATPRAHAPAVSIALFLGLAALLVLNFPLIMGATGSEITLAELLNDPARMAVSLPALPGMLALFGANSGWLVSGLILVAMTVALIDKKYKAAAIWCGTAAILTAVGLLHSYQVQDNVIREYFIWQQVEVAAADTQPVLAEAQTIAAATAHVHAYRAFPIAIGYALLTLLFALVAWRAGCAEAEPDDMPAFEPTPVIAAAPPFREELPSIPLADSEQAPDTEERPGDEPLPPERAQPG
ncbi:MAG: NCS2 family permease [Planctomycetes bacterium]|nr:NCS2 family permease [Planctomycetota bacterium]